MGQKLSQLVDTPADSPSSACRMRRSLLVFIPLFWVAPPVAAQTSEGTPLDLEQRLRLRRELRQAHRMRDGRGGDAPADGEGSGQTSVGGDREPSSDELNPSAHLEPTEVRRRAGPAHWAHDHPPGSGPHGFLLNPEERMHLRRQLREQGFAHRAAGAPPATAPQQPTP